MWDDRRIDAGATWYPEITEAMNRAKVAVLLISADFLASTFCVKEEVPFLLKRRETEGLVVIPVLIRHCPFDAIDWLHPIQMLPRDGKSVAFDFTEAYDVVFNDVAHCVLEAVDRPAEVKLPPVVELPAPESPPLPDEAIDIDRLPVTGAELFGRQRELTMLDEAWGNEKLNVLSFVAWGGVGKSTLVRRWLDRLAADNYRGARRVFGWSFYSQGTNERVSSADRFISTALQWFGDRDPTAGSPWAKGERLAKLVADQGTLLILDGMEPLQSPREVDRGHIKDPALMMLVRGLARHNPGLCVITTRVNVRGLDRFKEGFAEHDLEQISPEAGRALLRVRGVRGTDAELEATAKAFGCHALAIKLLASYLHDIPGHPIEAAAEIPDLDIPEEKGKHPRRVIAAFEKRFGEGPEVELLRILGLFDRPATRPELDAVLATPRIKNLTGRVRKLSEAARIQVVDRLRDIGLVAKRSKHAPDELDAHPLVREHFGEQLRENYPEAWRAGHDRLYEYLKGPGCAKEYPDTIEEMAPLFAAMTHGCAAGRRQDTLHEVYWPRIQRGANHYTRHKFGAFGADLGALTGLFDEPWCRPAASLTEATRAFLLHEASFDLGALGRLPEALDPMLVALEMRVTQEKWHNAAIAAGNISGLLLTLGRVKEAIDYARRGVDFADRSSDAFQRMAERTTFADALQQAGTVSEAEVLFREAEQMEKNRQSEYPVLYSLWGYRYCDALLARGDHQDVIVRVSSTIEIAKRKGWILDIALDHLSLGRAHLLKAEAEGSDVDKQAREHLDLAVDGLREAGGQEFIPCGLLARAELHIFTGDYQAARADLDEALEIATRDPKGPMKLHVTDCHLGYARLALARDDAATAAKRLADAREHLKQARDLIADTGYHRRDGELEELERQVADA